LFMALLNIIAFLFIAAVVVALVGLTFRVLFWDAWYYLFFAKKFACPACGRTIKQVTRKPKRQPCPKCKAVLEPTTDGTWVAVDPTIAEKLAGLKGPGR